MLIMVLRNNQLLGMSIKRLSPMEKIGLCFVKHLDYRIYSPINNVNNIPVCLHTICREPFENGYTQPFSLNNSIQLPPQNAFNFCVLGFHVKNHNCHDLTIDQVVNVTCHGRPSLNTLYVIEHHPHILEIVA